MSLRERERVGMRAFDVLENLESKILRRNAITF